jgi:hypothetical protein
MSKIITTHQTLHSSVDDVADAHHPDALPRMEPCITSAAGVLALGQRLELTIQPPGGRPMRFKP